MDGRSIDPRIPAKATQPNHQTAQKTTTVFDFFCKNAPSELHGDARAAHALDGDRARKGHDVGEGDLVCLVGW